MAKKKPIYGCTVKQLPEEDWHEAAMFAVSCNPANRPPSGILAKFGLEAPPERFEIAMTSKYFGPAGVHLSVGFLEPTSAALADKIVSYMNGWSKYANASFTMASGPASKADVRISRGAGGYYSYLGTDVLRIPQGQPTMNLQGFTLNTPESEYRRVVYHETGHTLGSPHEHSRPEMIARLDQQKTIALYMRTQGWSQQEVQQQILTPPKDIIKATPLAEEDSIMCYSFPGSITLDGKPIVGGTDITRHDAEFMAAMYPLAITPPPTADKTIVTVEVTGKTARVVSVA